MKNECDIVKDLLFSYNDGVLSTSSKEFVDEHLNNCKECKKVMQDIQNENKSKTELKEIDFFKKVKKNINKKNIIISISIVVILIIILFNILVYKNYNEIASNMEIYLKEDITNEELENIKNRVIELGDNIELEYISKEASLEKLKNKFKEKKDLLEGYDNSNNPLPASIEIKTSADVEQIAKDIQNMPGISKISTHLNVNPYVLFVTRFYSN